MRDFIGDFVPRCGRPDTPRHKLFYGRARWKRLRLRKLARNPVCEYCDNALAVDVDHVDGDNTNNELTNLKSACKRCHGIKTRREDM